MTQHAEEFFLLGVMFVIKIQVGSSKQTGISTLQYNSKIRIVKGTVSNSSMGSTEL